MNTLQLISIIIALFGHSLLSANGTTPAGHVAAFLAFLISILLAIIGD